METLPKPEPENPRSEFSRLMRENHRELLVFAGAATRNSEAARDVVQEAFVTAWKKFETFESDRDFGSWMRGIVRNKTRDWFRKQQKQPVSDSEMIDMEIDWNDWQTAGEGRETVFDRVEICIAKLPANYKSAVRAFYFEDRSGAEAADSLSISPANLRKRLERARALLHECLSLSKEASTEIQPDEIHV